MWYLIIVLILTMTSYILALFYRKNKHTSIIIFGIMSFTLFLYGGLAYRNGQTDALKGNYKYEMKIQKIYENSVLIKTDILYIRKEVTYHDTTSKK